MNNDGGVEGAEATDFQKNNKNAGWALSSCILHITIDVATGGCAVCRAAFGSDNGVYARGNGVSAHRKGENNLCLTPSEFLTN